MAAAVSSSSTRAGASKSAASKPPPAVAKPAAAATTKGAAGSKSGAASSKAKKQPEAAGQKVQTAGGVGSDDEPTLGELLSDSELRMLDEANALKSQTESCERALSHLECRIAEASRRVGRLELRYPSGFLWRLDDIAARAKAARNGQATVVDSPAQYVSRVGYRIAMRACLNGEGRARGKYISLFVSICRGEFDCLLTWPFKMRIYLSIVDQAPAPNGRRDISRVIMPNTCRDNAAFLGRPVTDRNPAFGIEEFAPLDLVLSGQREYVKDNAMYFKLDIPSEDLVTDFC